MKILLQLTTSTRRSTFLRYSFRFLERYFNSRPPHGGRLQLPMPVFLYAYFNSRPPHGGRQELTTLAVPTRLLQLTTSTRRSTVLTSPNSSLENFNSRPPHGGRRPSISHRLPYIILQLTTSTRRSTCCSDYHNIVPHYFNSRPPHGGRHSGHDSILQTINTSTHDLHTEVDPLLRRIP